MEISQFFFFHMIFSQFCDVAITGNHLQVELTKFGYNLDLESFSSIGCFFPSIL